MKKFFTSIIAPIFLLTGFNVHSETASSVPDFQASYLQPTAPISPPPKSHTLQAHPPSAYPPSAYPPSAYPPSAYPPSAYPPSAYPPSAYPPSAYPPFAYPQPHTVVVAPSTEEFRISHKSSITAGILNLVGGFSIGGIGRLYAGSTAMGIGQLLLSFLLPGVGQLWSLIDGAYILCGAATDSEGRHLVSHPAPFHTTIQQVIPPPYY